MKRTRFTPIKLLVCMMVFIGFAPASFAQTAATTPAAEKSMEVKRIALVDLDGVLRAADANNRFLDFNLDAGVFGAFIQARQHLI